MSFNLTSQKLLETLKQVGSRFYDKRIGARLTVGEDAAWWYYHEFGTATHEGEGTFETPPSISVQEPEGGTGSSYDILPKNGDGIRLPATAGFPESHTYPAIGMGYTREHPGVPALGLVRTVLEDIHTKAASDIITALKDGEYEPQSVQEALTEQTIPAALSSIVESIAEKLHTPERDTPGKLSGVPPEEVFRESATISAEE
jgi:hypothetical protein